MGDVVIIDKTDLLRAGKSNPANLVRLARFLKKASISDPEAEYAKLPESVRDNVPFVQWLANESDPEAEYSKLPDHVRERVPFVQWLVNELEDRIIPPKRGGWY